MLDTPGPELNARFAIKGRTLWQVHNVLYVPFKSFVFESNAHFVPMALARFPFFCEHTGNIQHLKRAGCLRHGGERETDKHRAEERRGEDTEMPGPSTKRGVV